MELFLDISSDKKSFKLIAGEVEMSFDKRVAERLAKILNDALKESGQ